MIFLSLFAIFLPLFSFSKSSRDSDHSQFQSPNGHRAEDPERMVSAVSTNFVLGNSGHSDHAQVPSLNDRGDEAFEAMILPYPTKFGLLADSTIFEISKFLLQTKNMKIVYKDLHNSLSLASNLRFYSRFAFSMPEISDFNELDPEVQYILSKYSRFNKKNLFVFLCHDLFVMNRFSKLQIPIARFLARIHKEILQIDPNPLRDLILIFTPVMARFLLDREEYRVFFEISDNSNIVYFLYHEQYYNTFKFIIENRKYYQKYIEFFQRNISFETYGLHKFINLSIKHRVPLELFEHLICSFSEFENLLYFIISKNNLNNPSDYDYYISILNHFLAKFPSKRTEELSLLIAVRFEEESSHINNRCVEEFKTGGDHSYLMRAAVLSRTTSLLRHLIDNGVDLLDFISPSTLYPISQYSSTVFAIAAEYTRFHSRMLANYDIIYAIINSYSYDTIRRDIDENIIHINYIISPVPGNNYTVPVVLNLIESKSMELITDFFAKVWAQIDEDMSVAKFEYFFAIYLNIMETRFHAGPFIVNLTEKSMVFFARSQHLIGLIRNRPFRFSLTEKMTGFVFESRNMNSLELLRDLIDFQMNELIPNLRTEEQIVNMEHFFNSDIVTLFFSGPSTSPQDLHNWKAYQYFKLRPVFAYILKTPTLRQRIIEFRNSRHVFYLIELEFREDMRQILN